MPRSSAPHSFKFRALGSIALALLLPLAFVAAPATPAMAQDWGDDEDEGRGGIDEERLIELIEETVRANEERRLGREFLVDYETRAEQLQAEQLRRGLATRRVTVNFDQTTFAECIEFLIDVTGENIVLSKEIREEYGEQNIRLRLKRVTLRSCLNLLLEQTGEDVRYGYRHGVLWIGNRGERKQRLVLRFYDVSDIVRKLPDFPGPRLGLDGVIWDD